MIHDMINALQFFISNRYDKQYVIFTNLSSFVDHPSGTAEVLRPKRAKVVINCYGVLLPVRYKTAERVTM